MTCPGGRAAGGGARPQRGDEIELTRRLPGARGRRRRPARGLRRLRARCDSGRPRARHDREAQEGVMQRHGSPRSSSRGRTGSSRRLPHPGAPWQVLPYQRQLEVKQEQVPDALRAARAASRRRPSSRSCPHVTEWRYRNKMEYSFGAGPEDELLLGFHRAARWNEIDEVETDVLAPEVGGRGTPGGEGVVRCRGAERLGQGNPRWLPPEPRRARRRAYGAAPGAGDHQRRRLSRGRACIGARASTRCSGPAHRPCRRQPGTEPRRPSSAHPTSRRRSRSTGGDCAS